MFVISLATSQSMGLIVQRSRGSLGLTIAHPGSSPRSDARRFTSHPGWRLALLLVGLMLGVMRPALAEPLRVLSAEERAAVAEMLRASWQGFSSEIVQADIEYVSILLECGPEIFSEVLPPLLEALPLDDADALARQLLAALHPALLAGDDEAIAQRCRELCDSKRLLLNGPDLRCLSERFEHLLQDDLHLVVDCANHAVTAHSRGRCPYWCEDLEWFRPAPSLEVLHPDATLVERGGLIQIHYAAPLEQPGSELWVDPDDAQPRRWNLVYPSTGDLTRIHLFAQHVTWPGDVVLPAIRVQANLQQGRLSHLQLTAIRRAQFNVEPDPAALVLSAPEQWKWFDRRTDQPSAGHWPRPVEDVALFFQHRTAAPVALATAGGSGGISPRSWILIANGLALLALGFVFWRRAM